MKYCQIKKTNKVEKIECMRSRRKDIFQHSTRRKQSRKDRMDKFLEIRKEIVNMQQYYQDYRDVCRDDIVGKKNDCKSL